MPTRSIKKYNIQLTIWRGEMAKVIGELSQTMLAERTQDISDTAALELIPQPRGEELGSNNHNLDSLKVLAPASDQPCQVCSWQGHGTKVSCVHSWAPLRKSRVCLAPYTPAEVYILSVLWHWTIRRDFPGFWKRVTQQHWRFVPVYTFPYCTSQEENFVPSINQKRSLPFS